MARSFSTPACRIRTRLESSGHLGSKKGGVDSAWIKSFRDPALESYIGEVVAGNIELGAALHAVEAAAGSARQAGALLRPQLNAAGMVKSS